MEWLIIFIFIFIFTEFILSLYLYKIGRSRGWGIFFNITKDDSFVMSGLNISRG
jgi:hypothetical protein